MLDFISQCDVKHIMMLLLQTMTSVLKVFTNIMMLPLQTMTSVLKVFTDIMMLPLQTMTSGRSLQTL